MNRFLFRFLLCLVFILLCFSPMILFAQKDLGIPVKAAVLWGAHAGPGKSGAIDTIYLSFGQYGAPLFLLAVNPDTGEIRQFKGPLSSEMGSWGFTIDHENRIYLGSYYNGHLLRFDPKTERWEDLGQPGGEKESFICRVTTAPDGKIWGGTFPSAKLFSYDPKTGKSENYGRMDPDQFYCYPTAGEDGLIYCAIQFEKVDLVVFDPEKKTRTSLLPMEARKPGRINLTKGSDGKVYAKLSPPDRWFRIEGGTNLRVLSESGVPFPPRGLPDGRTFQVVDHKILKIEDPVTKMRREISLNYDAAGSFIFVVGTGPEGRIYGSSMLPLRLFVYDPQSRSTANLGKAAYAEGEIYSIGSHGGKLYLCSYPGARLSIYDPKMPVRFGEDEKANPRDLGPMGDGLDRPRTMVAGPRGRIYVGGYPDYGHLGGALGVFDPEKNEKRVYRHVIQNQSIASLARIEALDLLAAGSSVRGGSGTRAVEKDAKLILWDPKDERKVFEIVPVPGARTIVSLAATGEGVVYGITEGGKVFAFDAMKREMRKVFNLGFKNPLEISLQSGPDGKLYGLAEEAIFSIDPKDDWISLLRDLTVPATSGMAIRERKIYYGSGPNLYEFEIPESPPQHEIFELFETPLLLPEEEVGICN